MIKNTPEVIGQEEFDRRFELICEQIAATDENMKNICLNNGLSYYYVHKYAGIEPAKRDLLSAALVDRAIGYHDKCKQIVDQIEEFWEQELPGRDGNTCRITRERTSAVNKARLQVDWYSRACEQLAPVVFGDHRDQIKEVQRKIDDLRSLMLENISKY